MNYPYSILTKPKMTWTKQTDKTSDMKVGEWIETVGENLEVVADYDISLLGVPLSKSSISQSAASDTPDAIRNMWGKFNTYNLDEDVDLADLKIVDLGDVKQHVTDISVTHENIRKSMAFIQEKLPKPFPITLGGDHSITAELAKGMKEAKPEERIGILQIDTHFDLRSLEEFGPANGTPIRHLIESETVKGSDVYNIGLHGFLNQKELKDYADEKGVNYMTLKQLRKEGIEETLSDVLAKLKEKVDTVYFTVDMDVLDIIHGPGTPAASPGGMYSEELFEIVQTVGKEEIVKAMDIVCVDPRKDIADITVKNTVHTLLSFLVGYYLRTT